MLVMIYSYYDLSVINLNNASFEWGCNFATHCSDFVQLCLRKTHLVQHPVCDWDKRGKAGGLPPANATILNCRRMMVKQSLVSPANFVLLQVLKTIWHRIFFGKRFKLCFDIIIYSKDIGNSIAHKLADMTQLPGAILSSSSSTQCWRSFF